MTWSVTISGHIGSRETERDVVDGFRKVVRELNSDGTTFASEAILVSSYHGRVNLLEEEQESFKFAQPMKLTEEDADESDVTLIDGTDNAVVDSEIFQAENDEKNKEESEINTSSKTEDSGSKQTIKSLDEITDSSPKSSIRRGR